MHSGMRENVVSMSAAWKYFNSANWPLLATSRNTTSRNTTSRMAIINEIISDYAQTSSGWCEWISVNFTEKHGDNGSIL